MVGREQVQAGLMFEIPCASKITKCNDIYNLDDYAERDIQIDELLLLSWQIEKKLKF